MAFFDFDGDFEWVRFPEDTEDGSFDDKFGYEDIKAMLKSPGELFAGGKRQEYLAKLEAERERRKKVVK